jgi:hypothetical protein
MSYRITRWGDYTPEEAGGCATLAVRKGQTRTKKLLWAVYLLRKFIAEFADIAKPLAQLIEGNRAYK